MQLSMSTSTRWLKRLQRRQRITSSPPQWCTCLSRNCDVSALATCLPLIEKPRRHCSSDAFMDQWQETVTFQRRVCFNSEMLRHNSPQSWRSSDIKGLTSIFIYRDTKAESYSVLVLHVGLHVAISLTLTFSLNSDNRLTVYRTGERERERDLAYVHVVCRWRLVIMKSVSPCSSCRQTNVSLRATQSAPPYHNDNDNSSSINNHSWTNCNIWPSSSSPSKTSKLPSSLLASL